MRKFFTKTRISVFVLVFVFGLVITFPFLSKKFANSNEVDSTKSEVKSDVKSALSIQEPKKLSFEKPQLSLKKVEFPDVTAGSVVVYDIETGRYLHEKEAETKRPIASLTKLMTAMLVDKYGEYNEEFVVDEYAYGAEGDSGQLFIGEKLSIDDLMYLIMLESSNDAATTLAQYIVTKYTTNQVHDLTDTNISVKKEDLFVKLMNREAEQYGLNNTNYIDPHGLDDEKAYSTARDITVVFNEFIKNDKLLKYIKTKNKIVKSKESDTSRNAENTNELLGVTEGVIGGKTGYTHGAGECLITLWEHESGRKEIIVVIGAKDRFGDTKKIINWLNNSLDI